LIFLILYSSTRGDSVHVKAEIFPGTPLSRAQKRLLLRLL
jgi:hypothetical protein